jgi:hypothetical protein
VDLDDLEPVFKPHETQNLEELKDVVYANYVPIYETETMTGDNSLKGPGISIYDNHEHIVEGPHFACSDCGNTDWDRFRTVKTENLDGTEYDLECGACGSLETEESPAMALHRMAVKLEMCRVALENLGFPS